MRTNLFAKLSVKLLAAALTLWLGALTASAQIYSQNIVGYINVTLKPGFNLICNQLSNGSNSIAQVMPAVPDGTKVFLWDVTNQVFLTPATYQSGAGWNTSLTLSVGRGFMVQNNSGSDSVITFTGLVNTGTNLTNPLLGGNKLNLIGAIVPDGLSLEASNFILADRETVFEFNPANGSFNNAKTYFAGQGWYQNTSTAQPVDSPAILVGAARFIRHPGPDYVWTRSFTPFRLAAGSGGALIGSGQNLGITQLNVQNGQAALVINNPDGVAFDVYASNDYTHWKLAAANQTGTAWTGTTSGSGQQFFQVVKH